MSFLLKSRSISNPMELPGLNTFLKLIWTTVIPCPLETWISFWSHNYVSNSSALWIENGEASTPEFEIREIKRANQSLNGFCRIVVLLSSMLTLGGIITSWILYIHQQWMLHHSRLEHQSCLSRNTSYHAHNTAGMEPLHILMPFLPRIAHVPEHRPSWHAHMYFSTSP
jgi:hypothetical protein